jgi:hypothetical protein
MHGRRVYGLIRRHFVGLRKSQSKTVADLLVGLMVSARLGLANIARGMRDCTSVRHRIKRLWRFARNGGLSLEAGFAGLIDCTCPNAPGAPMVIALDWTDLGPYQLLCACCAIGRRAVPIVWTIMATGQFSRSRKSRNDVEERLILRLANLLAKRSWVLVADRGFARASLFKNLADWHILYVIRACGRVWVESRTHRGILDNLVRCPRRMVRWDNVLYHKKCRVPVHLVMTHREPAAEPWYLVTNIQGIKQVVAVYRRRMWIEESFRDAKSHLGLRKLWLARADRMERLFLLAALLMLMAVLVALDQTRRPDARDLQLTTKRKGPTFSLFRIGLYLIQTSGLPPGLSRLRLLHLYEPS